MTTNTPQREQDDVQGFLFALYFAAVTVWGAVAAVSIGFSGSTDVPTGSSGDKNGIGGWCPV